ncbi:MAG: hypothetical protein WAK56_10720, partial [Candidatus Sulfotelmatobacter sp.]
GKSRVLTVASRPFGMTSWLVVLRSGVRLAAYTGFLRGKFPPNQRHIPHSTRFSCLLQQWKYF